MHKEAGNFVERKIFGGVNFIVVLWTLISVLRLAISVDEDPWSMITSPDMFVYVLPLLFMTVLNILMGITLFFPQEKNKLWLISLIIVTTTLVILNSFQLRLDAMIAVQHGLENPQEF